MKMEMVLMMGMMLMMISMMPVTMVMTMATSPLPGGDLPGGICPPEMAFLLCSFPPRSGGGTPKTLLFLGFLDHEEYIGQRGEPGVAPGVQAPSRRGQGWGRTRWSPEHP